MEMGIISDEPVPSLLSLYTCVADLPLADTRIVSQSYSEDVKSCGAQTCRDATVEW